MRRLFEDGTYSSNYCNWQLNSLLHLGQIVITFRTLFHLGSFITFRPSTIVNYQFTDDWSFLWVNKTIGKECGLNVSSRLLGRSVT